MVMVAVEWSWLPWSGRKKRWREGERDFSKYGSVNLKLCNCQT